MEKPMMSKSPRAAPDSMLSGGTPYSEKKNLSQRQSSLLFMTS